tara:strand:+ start:45 stop:1982 length:1938 start_codon:yes stop_codon:yes gene_type:complete
MPDHYDEKDYEKNRRSNRPEFGEREKFGTEFMDNLEQSAVGKFFDLSGERQAVLDQASREGKLGKVSQFTQKIEDKVGEVAAPVLKPVGAALGKISDVTQIDERISTPLTFVAAGAAAKGISKIKPKHLGITQTIEPYTPPKSVGKIPRNIINITDEVLNMERSKYQRLRNVLKKNPGMSYQDAMDYVNLVEKGTPPTKPIKPGNRLLKSTDKDDPVVYLSPEERPDDTFFSMNVDPEDIPRNDLSMIRTPGKQGKVVNEKFTQLAGIKGGRLNLKVYRKNKKSREFAELYLTPYGKGVPFQGDAKDKSGVLKAIFGDTMGALGIPPQAGIQAHHKTPIKTILPSFEGVVYDSPKYHKFVKEYFDAALALGNMPSNIMSILGHAGRDYGSPHFIVHAFMRATFGESGENFWTPERLQQITVYDEQGNAIGTKNDELRIKFIKEQVKNIKESIDILNIAQEEYEVISGGKNPVQLGPEEIVNFFFNKLPARNINYRKPGDPPVNPKFENPVVGLQEFTTPVIRNIVKEIVDQFGSVPQYDQLTMQTIVDKMSLDAIDEFIKTEENIAMAEDMILDVIFEGKSPARVLRENKRSSYRYKQLGIRFRSAIKQAQKAPVITLLKDLYRQNREKEPPSIGSSWDMFDKDE